MTVCGVYVERCFGNGGYLSNALLEARRGDVDVNSNYHSHSR